jgi:Polyketide cyclase / dehydrase and lipid transport
MGHVERDLFGQHGDDGVDVGALPGLDVAVHDLA